MQRSHFTNRIKTAVIGTLVLLLGATLAVAQQQVNLTAGPTTLTMPDGSIVPMWGYSCGTAVAGSTATCAALNTHAPVGAWSPVVITVPSGQSLAINLTNSLVFNGNAIPTSIVIAGQLGGGLGKPGTSNASPAHENLSTTWPIANTGPVFVPPSQPNRVQSFATEVAGGTATAVGSPLTWTAPRPGTYLLESGTHPSIQVPMGLIGMLVVTCSPTDTISGCATGTAYPAVGTTPAVAYNADVPLLFSEIDPAQNKAVDAAVKTTGFSEIATLGPYSAQPLTSINLLNGGQKYTSAPTVSFSGTGGALATALVDSDPSSSTYQQVTGFNIINGGSYTSAPNVIISGGGGTGASADAALQLAASNTCSGGALACYPPAVNYTPLYYLINGQAFDKTNATNSLFPAAPATGVTGNVLVRLVNAGLRMHVPSIVGAQTGSATSAAAGFSLIAEDGNPLPGIARVQSEVFMAAGKTYDVMINTPAAGGSGLPVYDRELSLSGNSTNRDSGMLAYIGINGAGLPVAAGTGAFAAATVNPDTYNALVAGQTLTVSDPSKGVIANDVNVFGVQLDLTKPAGNGTVTLNANGTFTYVPTGTMTSDSFGYCANGTTTICTTVTLGSSALTGGTIACNPGVFTASNARYLAIKTPGALATCTDSQGLPLTIDTSVPVTATPAATNGTNGTVIADVNGGFTATATGPGTYTFNFTAKNSVGTTGSGQVTLTFPTGSGLAVTVLDGADHTTTITDYRWVIEEDQTFYVDPKCTANPLPAGCPTISGAAATATSSSSPILFGTNFHTSHMPLVATGCTGAQSCEGGQTMGSLGNVVCDVGNGVCRPDATGNGFTAVTPDQVHLDPTKRYYISVLPGDAADPFNAGYAGSPDCAGVNGGVCGHGMGGAPIAAGQTSVSILTQPSPYPPAKLSVFVFQDDWPLNGEHDAGGGIDVIAPQEAGLGSFQITLFDDAGGTGDATGQPTYDMFNMPLTNSLAGTIDPVTGLDACPISPQVTANVTPDPKHPGLGLDGNPLGSQKGIVGMIVTCPTYESDGATLSPLAGQAVVNNLYQGRYGVMATPAADRIARGEEWLQTNTLDGQKAHDSFMRIGEPAYFQEFGPAGYHVTIGFANPKIINDRLAGVCAGQPCPNNVTGHVTTARMSRTPDERLYGSGTHDSYAFTQCYAAIGDPDGEAFSFAKCDDQGQFSFAGIPSGNYKVTIFDQWNDQVVDGISMPVNLDGSTANTDLGEIAAHQWQANIYTRSFIDTNGDGISTKDTTGVPCTDTNTPPGCNANYGNDAEPGLTLVATNIRFRDGSFSNFNNTDLNGYAGFNEVFPLFNWYTIETDSTRYKTTGVHVVYDAGGPTDGFGGGSSTIANALANTVETVSLPTNLRVPGAVYCNNADCIGSSIATGPVAGGSSGPASGLSTGRIDPPTPYGSYGWQGFSGQNSFLEFGKKPFAAGETGGIHGHVVYASTRPFDDPQLLLQLSWEPLVPHVRVNLYKKGLAADGLTETLTLVDYTDTTSFDDWAQGFRTDGMPNMNCPGQLPAPTATTAGDLFFYGLSDQPNYLDWYNSQHGGPAPTALPNHSQFKCYDGMHNWNQLQPAPYDGMYTFPSVINQVDYALDPKTGQPVGSHCTGCVPNPDTTDPFRAGTPMLPAGTYVVEVVVPPGYELVKEEDKNILIGDNYIAPVTQQFAGLGNIFILPDQAEIAAGSAAQNTTQSLGRLSNLPSHEGDTGSVESFWPCVGEPRVVPDFISLFPGSAEVSPFAGATRNLCDRKEVTLDEQTSALAKFYIFTSTHIASHFTGVITDDFTAEFDPFSPQFGEKFAPAYLPVSVKDWTGNEISRVYSDAFGSYNGLSYSTWEVNPPNPTGYGPTMMVTCMNDPGSGATPDALYQPNYSQFCYELPFMPGQTGYFDTPVVPTSAFAGAGYNNPDCSYPDTTPSISSVIGSDGVAGPWVSGSGAGHTLTITALGDQQVPNNAYTGPGATTAPYNQKTITRHYDFGPAPGGTVTIGGKTATVTSWSPTTITVTAPNNVGLCSVQQQAFYSGTSSNARCGQLLITRGDNGKQSIDTVTVTIGGKKPTVLTAGQTIQSAIDGAKPGDMIIVPQGTYNEMVIMWKPVRLQGVGAASSIINANTHPAGRLDAWRKQVVCLFGLTTDGRPSGGSYAGCPGTGWTNLPGTNANFPSMIVDRVTMEAVLGWDASLNGNLAEQLIEPSLMGAYEGAAITVLGKGVNIPANSTDPFGSSGAAVAAFPTGTVVLTAADCNVNGSNPYPSNFYCNPSSIDGLTLSNSSQGGGGIFVHAWGHNIQIANNRVKNNQGTLSGGITVGQGEHVDVQLAGAGPSPVPPDSCEINASGHVTNQGLPFCYNMNVNVHNNSVTLNSSLGDELFSSTPAGAGGVTFCNGSDYYQFNYNWVCGNMSTGDGGGVAHLGYSKNGDIEHNSILFNQSTNPTITTNGGGLLVMGAPDLDPTCGTTTDVDCVPDPTQVPPSDGTGPGLVINANLILGNAADSGSGGGLRLQHVNGTDVLNFPNGFTACTNVATGKCLWNSVNITNNIITNNVAGWDGAGVSLQDALAVNIVNNTIASNDSTASSGVLFDSLFAPLASTPGTNCTINNGTGSCPQVAGLVSVTNSAILHANLPASGFSCPAGHGTAGSCREYSVPLLANDVIWQNRSFRIGVGGFGPGTTNQQKVVTLFNNDGSAVGSQAATGACPTSGSTYWEIGVRGDSGPGNHVVVNGVTASLSPSYSVLTDAADYSGANNLGTNPALKSQYCNGSRVPPEGGGMGWQVPPGTNESNALPTPVFSLTPAGTVDEGNNWINMSWGPLSLLATNGQTVLGNYALLGTSPAIDQIPASSPNYALAPSKDFFGNPRPDQVAPHRIDIGAVEFQGAGVAVVAVTPTSLSFGSWVVGTTSGSQNLTLSNTGGASFTGLTLAFTGPFSRATGGAGGNCGATLAAGATCTIGVVFSPTVAGATTGSVAITGNVAVTGSPVSLSGTGLAVSRSATVSPTSLAFGSWATGTTSTAQTVTVTNTGNVALAGGAFAFPSRFTRPGGGAGGTCGAALAVSATCTINVVFSPNAVSAFSGNLTVAYTGATVTGSPVSLTGTGVAMAVNPASLAFGNVAINTTSAAQTLSVRNSTGSARSLAIAVTAPFARPAGGAGGNCGATLNNGTTCTINIVYSPTAQVASTGSVTITTNGGFTVTNSPVALTGTGVAQVIAATLTPTSWSPTATRGCGILSCPVQAFTLTNTGNVTLTGIGNGLTGGATEFATVPLLSTCGPAVGGQLASTTTLAPGATCTVTGRFAPPTGDTAGVKNATLSVTDAAGTQSSTLTGTAN
ncbi:MAG TPA: choice-of-anchor D domain-containing protein [Candidatus Sulfotelmatobacter sp.]|nr:choice-of-anchor D domain-containing protein [Candidatus Sulfotelmatobacter sp.]